MELRNCKKCGRAFAYKGIPVCLRCKNDDEDEFMKVKDYLYDNTGATIREVSDETGVDEKQILRYLKESRIEIIEEGNFVLECERCGKSLRSGRFCDVCVSDMSKEFSSAIKPKINNIKEKPKVKEKMYISDKLKRK
ncbi:MAG: MerR family transcriptional regulator [Alkaliphilus sp.]|nr:MerR family transcriptional regulator [Alkaliphilus sp. AH-315-G20]PHS35391.1 MAG: MerR family transcriptional regulator [Alkaliphilus sp.]